MSDYFLEVKNLTKHFPLNNDLISRLGGKGRTPEGRRRHQLLHQAR